MSTIHKDLLLWKKKSYFARSHRHRITGLDIMDLNTVLQFVMAEDRLPDTTITMNGSIYLSPTGLVTTLDGGYVLGTVFCDTWGVWVVDISRYGDLIK